MFDYEIVVARFDENLSWLDSVREHCIIYNKGTTPTGFAIEYYDENVGREAHTYLTHIIRHYDSLPDVVVFTQGSMVNHFSGGADTLNRIALQAFTERRAIGAGTSIIARPNDHDWGREWNKNYYGHQGEWYLGSAAYRDGTPYTFDAWFRRIFGKPSYEGGKMQIFRKAVFAVPRDIIMKRPRSFYENLIQEVTRGANIIEQHFMERSWGYMFA